MVRKYNEAAQDQEYDHLDMSLNKLELQNTPDTEIAQSSDSDSGSSDFESLPEGSELESCLSRFADRWCPIDDKIASAEWPGVMQTESPDVIVSESCRYWKTPDGIESRCVYSFSIGRHNNIKANGG